MDADSQLNLLLLNVILCSSCLRFIEIRNNGLVLYVIVFFLFLIYTLRNPNEGPFSPPLQWTPFNTFEQNYLQQSPEFSMETFYDDNLVDRYRFWVDFPDHVQYPPDPTFPPMDKLTEQGMTELFYSCVSFVPNKPCMVFKWKGHPNMLISLIALKQACHA